MSDFDSGEKTVVSIDSSRSIRVRLRKGIHTGGTKMYCPMFFNFFGASHSENRTTQANFYGGIKLKKTLQVYSGEVIDNYEKTIETKSRFRNGGRYEFECEENYEYRTDDFKRIDLESLIKMDLFKGESFRGKHPLFVGTLLKWLEPNDDELVYAATEEVSVPVQAIKERAYKNAGLTQWGDFT